MDSQGVERRLAAILSADVVGYSRLMSEDEVATLRTLTAYREQLSVLIGQHRGRVVDSPGDNLLAEFPSASDAVRCAVELQRVLAAQNAAQPPARQLRYRMGVHLGDVMVEGERIYGDGVNVAARLEGLADPDGISISRAVRDQVEGKFDLSLEDRGEQPVKNVAEPVHVYGVRLDVPEALAAAPAPRSRALPLVLGLGLLLASAAAVLFWTRFAPAPSALPVVGKASIAVLPFTNMSGDPEQEYFADGITEDLITDLSKASGLFVIARNSTFTYKGKAVRVEDVGRELGVRYVLEGSVRRAGDRVRVTAQLLDAENGGHVWAERYDRELADIFAVQDELTEQIVAALRVSLSRAEQERVARRPTEDLDAYDSYLRGLSELGSFRQESLTRASALFERAIELDPGFADAYAMLSALHMLIWVQQFSSDSQTLERAEELARAALQVDASLPRPRAVLGGVYLFSGRKDAAVSAAREAVELDPSDAFARQVLGTALNFSGRPEEALPHLETARRLDPLRAAVSQFAMGNSYLLLGQIDAALAAYEKTARAPGMLGPRAMLAVLLVERGELERARALVREILEISPGYTLAESTRRLPWQEDVAERIRAALRTAGLP